MSATVSPYLAASFVLQVPSRLPIGLFTAATGSVYPTYYGDAHACFALSLGMSWRAW